MASGYYTGYQHKLLDHPDLTKEEFIKFCDDAFYHLGHFNITLEEAKRKKEKRQTEIINKITEAEEELQSYLSKTEDEWQQDYKDYVSRTIQSNRKYRNTYEKEKEKMRLIYHYVEQMKPHLNYIWEGFKEPELFQLDINSFDEYKEGLIESTRRNLYFRKEDLERLEDEESQVNDEKIKDYEAKKKAFLEGE